MKIYSYPNQYLYKRVLQAKLFIDENFATQLSLKNISDEAMFSKFHFTRLFKKSYGVSPHQYLNVVRIKNAKRFLEEDLSVTDTCAAVGFKSISSFTHLFKRVTGMPPANYQQRYQHLKLIATTSPLRLIPNCFSSQWRVK